MRIGTVLVLLGLALIVAGCSKCNPPFGGPRACHADAASTQ
jgi:hypothetical protein